MKGTEVVTSHDRGLRLTALINKTNPWLHLLIFKFNVSVDIESSSSI
jgi:hypothetical protein